MSEKVKVYHPQDLVNRIIDLETGELDGLEAIILYADLANAGLIGQLQGCYSRAFSSLLQGGILVKNAAGLWIANAERIEALYE